MRRSVADYIVVIIAMLLISTMGLLYLLYTANNTGKEELKLSTDATSKISVERTCKVLVLIDRGSNPIDVKNLIEANTPCEAVVTTEAPSLPEILTFDYFVCMKPLNPYLLRDIGLKIKEGRKFFFTEECFRDVEQMDGTGDSLNNLLKNYYGASLNNIIELNDSDIVFFKPVSPTIYDSAFDNTYYIQNTNLTLYDLTCFQRAEYMFNYIKGTTVDTKERDFVCRTENAFVIGINRLGAKKIDADPLMYIAMLINSFAKQ